MAAAVADFRPTTRTATKLGRGDGLTLQLEPTEDILAEVGRACRRGSTLARSSSVSRPRPGRSTGLRTSWPARASTSSSPTTSPRPDAGFAVETNRVTVLDRDGGSDDWPLLSKRQVADRLLDLVAARLDARDTAAHTPSMDLEARR